MEKGKIYLSDFAKQRKYLVENYKNIDFEIHPKILKVYTQLQETALLTSNLIEFYIDMSIMRYYIYKKSKNKSYDELISEKGISFDTKIRFFIEKILPILVSDKTEKMRIREKIYNIKKYRNIFVHGSIIREKNEDWWSVLYEHQGILRTLKIDEELAKQICYLFTFVDKFGDQLLELLKQMHVKN